jgi:hypothetical protein
MMRLRPPPDDVTFQDQPHIFRGARLILAYVAEDGPIPLTSSQAFKRVLVNCARLFGPLITKHLNCLCWLEVHRPICRFGKVALREH